jgi:hypothetical protein
MALMASLQGSLRVHVEQTKISQYGLPNSFSRNFIIRRHLKYSSTLAFYKHKNCICNEIFCHSNFYATEMELRAISRMSNLSGPPFLTECKVAVTSYAESLEQMIVDQIDAEN